MCSYFNFKVGGLEKHVYYLIRGLLKNRVKITLITAYRDPYTNATIPPYRGEKLTIIPLKHIIAPFNNPLILEISNILTKIGPDIIHIHDHYFYGSAISPILKKIIKRPLVLTIHTSKLRYDNFLKDLVVDLYDTVVGSAIFRAADKIIAVSRTTAYELVKRGVPRRKVVYIPNFLTIDFRKNYDEKIYSNIKNEGRFKILYVGRLVLRKGSHVLLRAFDIALRNGFIPRDSILMIVGKGPLEFHLKEMIAANLNLKERVIFWGTVSDIFLGTLYEASDIVILPSLSGETTSLVLREAIYFMRPFIASLTGGIQDYLLEGFWGFYVPPGDALALAKSLGKMYNLIIRNQAFVQKRVYENRERLLRTYSSESIISKTLQVYNEVLSNWISR
ncbi:MAG: glycosyltransferase family 4 protein [Nitrososphaeria archaeon]